MKTLSEMSDAELAAVQHQVHLAYIYSWMRSATIEEMREFLAQIEKHQAEVLERSHTNPAEKWAKGKQPNGFHRES